MNTKCNLGVRLIKICRHILEAPETSLWPLYKLKRSQIRVGVRPSFDSCAVHLTTMHNGELCGNGTFDSVAFFSVVDELSCLVALDLKKGRTNDKCKTASGQFTTFIGYRGEPVKAKGH